MVKFGSHYASVARIWRAGAVATALTLGVTGLSAVGYAQQQPAAKKAPEKAPAAAAKKVLRRKAPQSAWVKLCEAGQTVSKDKDGKEKKQDLKICMTMHERLDGNSGMTVVSAAVRKVEGQDKLFFMIMVPTEVVLKPGMRATFIPPDLWDKAVKGEQVDEKRLKEYRLDYTICHPGGCNAEIDASPELLGQPQVVGRLHGDLPAHRRTARHHPGGARRLRCGDDWSAGRQQGLHRCAPSAHDADRTAAARDLRRAEEAVRRAAEEGPAGSQGRAAKK